MSNAEPATEPQVIVLCGLPGVGKSTVGEMIAERTGGRLLRTDVVRHDLFESPTYDETETERVYAALFERAAAIAGEGRPVILDGTFRDRGLRDRAAVAAGEAGVPVVFVRVTCEEATAVERLRERLDDASDADVTEYERFREIFDPLDRDHVTVDNSGSLAGTRRQVERLF